MRYDWGDPNEGTTKLVEIPPNAISASGCGACYWALAARLPKPGTMWVHAVHLLAFDQVGGVNPSLVDSADSPDKMPRVAFAPGLGRDVTPLYRDPAGNVTIPGTLTTGCPAGWTDQGGFCLWVRSGTGWGCAVWSELRNYYCCRPKN